MEKYGIIYKITNKINDKVYIGQTTRKLGFDRRYSYNLPKNTRNPHLKVAIEKYGIDNFEITKEFDIAFSKKELDEKEKYWIKYYNSTNPNFGYNLQEGGANGKPNIATRLKMKQNSARAMLGKHHSEETKRKMSISQKKRKHYPLSEETKEKLRQANLGKKKSPETIEKIKLAMSKRNQNGKNNANARAVICITTGKQFATTKEACEYYSIHSNIIHKSCINNKYSCGKLDDGTKLYWSFLELE